MPGKRSKRSSAATNSNSAESIGEVMSRTVRIPRTYVKPGCERCSKLYDRDMDADRNYNYSPGVDRWLCAGCIDEIESEKREAAESERLQTRRNALVLPYRLGQMTFGGYDTGRGDLSARDRSRAWARDARDSPGIMLCGSPGVGKTHLGVAILNERLDDPRPLVETRPIGAPFEDCARFVDCGDLIASLQVCIQTKAPASEIIDPLRRCSLLLLDDLGSERSTEFSANTISLLLRGRWNDALTTVITSNLAPKALNERFDSRVISRMGGMCKDNVVLVQSKDYRLG